MFVVRMFFSWVGLSGVMVNAGGGGGLAWGQAWCLPPALPATTFNPEPLRALNIDPQAPQRRLKLRHLCKQLLLQARDKHGEEGDWSHESISAIMHKKVGPGEKGGLLPREEGVAKWMVVWHGGLVLCRAIGLALAAPVVEAQVKPPIVFWSGHPLLQQLSQPRTVLVRALCVLRMIHAPRNAMPQVWSHTRSHISIAVFTCVDLLMCMPCSMQASKSKVVIQDKYITLPTKSG